jgi:hypothetical protein
VLETAYAQKIDRLPDSARRGLLVAALIHGSDRQALRTALAAAEVDVSALEAAEDTRLISVDPSGVIFRHPLIRSATVQRRRALIDGGHTGGSPPARNATLPQSPWRLRRRQR